MSIKTDISTGEFLDKLTILQIKAERISAPDKLRNIYTELDSMQIAWDRSGHGRADLAAETQALREVNEQLWDIEDAIRELESRGDFGREFIRLARAVYITNDRRADIKRLINEKTGSGLVEEKSYAAYPVEPQAPGSGT